MTTLRFTKPYILVTRIGSNDTNNEYHNPRQHYREYNTVEQAFSAASRHMYQDEKPVALLRIVKHDENIACPLDGTEYRTGVRTDYFHNFTKALEEYKQGIRV